MLYIDDHSWREKKKHKLSCSLMYWKNSSKPFCKKPPLASKSPPPPPPYCIFINQSIAFAPLSPPRRRLCCRCHRCWLQNQNITPPPELFPSKNKTKQKSESSLLWTLKMCTCRVILNNFCMRYYTTTYYECLGTHFQAVSKQNRFEFPNCSRFLIPPPPPLQPLMKQAEALLFPKAKHNHDLWLMM